MTMKTDNENQADLFPGEAFQPSPRLKWKTRHRVASRKNEHLEPGEAPWEAFQVDPGQNETDAMCEALCNGTLATGETEDEALTEWAQLTRTPLWHEEDHLLESAWKQIEKEEFLEALAGRGVA